MVLKEDLQKKMLMGLYFLENIWLVILIPQNYFGLIHLINREIPLKTAWFSHKKHCMVCKRKKTAWFSHEKHCMVCTRKKTAWFSHEKILHRLHTEKKKKRNFTDHLYLYYSSKSLTSSIS